MTKFPRFSFSRKESEILAGLREDFALVRGTVESFRLLAEAVAEGHETDSSLRFAEVLAGEDKADDSHRSLSMEIAQGAFFGGVREDILNMLEKMDNIADSAKDAARFLESEGNLDSFAISVLKSENMRLFIQTLEAAVDALGEVIAAFELGKKEMLARIPKVEQLEETADTYKDQLMKEIFSPGAEGDPLMVIQLRDFMFRSDDIADNAEDASDIVLILAAKGYG